MSTPDSHESYEELAAGYALSALEPAEESVFLAHLDGCARCQELLADFSDVAADVALVSASDELPAGMWAGIRDAARLERPPADTAGVTDMPPPVTGEPAAADGAQVVDLASRRRRTYVAWTAAAAALLLVIGVGGWRTLSGGSGTDTSVIDAAASQCRSSATCKLIELHGDGNSVPAYVMVNGRGVQVASASLPAIDPASQLYVLWQMPSHARPRAVAGFDVTTDNQGTIVGTGTLPLPYDDTGAFGISVEDGPVPPRAPTRAPIVVGAVA